MIDRTPNRVKSGKSVPGIVEVTDDAQIGRAIQDILLIAEANQKGEWEGMVICLRLKFQPSPNPLPLLQYRPHADPSTTPCKPRGSAQDNERRTLGLPAGGFCV